MKKRKFTTEDHEQIRKICEQSGMKLTHQRLEIYKELLAASDHPSAEDVHKRLQKRMPTVALDTVYRTLATFNEMGIARRLHLANNRDLFDINVAPHHHFICTSCRKVEDVSWPAFDITSLPQEVAGLGEVRSRHLELHGICNGCLARDRE